MKAVILAAGQGKRLRGSGPDVPKVLRQLQGKPLLTHVLQAIDFISPADTVLVVGYARDTVTSAYPAYPYAVQEQQLGTGHATAAAEVALRDYDGPVLVGYGDMPLVRRETYLRLWELHRTQGNACTILTGITPECDSFGRILRRADGSVYDIRERRDCTPEQAAVREKNSGVYLFDARLLFSALKRVKNENSQKEYYLTDVPKLLIADGYPVGALALEGEDAVEIFGVNAPEDLTLCEEVLKRRQSR